ncbi:MAG: hypothetical protein OHK0039_33470 [Bacteroidia bacterium]
MLIPTDTRHTYSYDDYLALAAEQEQKYEYHDGSLVAMAGGTPEHGQIGMNLGRAIGNALEAAGQSCRVYSSDVRVHIEATRRSFYPDISVV